MSRHEAVKPFAAKTIVGKRIVSISSIEYFLNGLAQPIFSHREISFTRSFHPRAFTFLRSFANTQFGPILPVVSGLLPFNL